MKNVRHAVDRKLYVHGLAWTPGKKADTKDLVEAMKGVIRVVTPAGADCFKVAMPSVPRFSGKTTNFLSFGPIKIDKHGAGHKIYMPRCVVAMVLLKCEYHPDAFFYAQFRDGDTFDF